MALDGLGKLSKDDRWVKDIRAAGEEDILEWAPVKLGKEEPAAHRETQAKDGHFPEVHHIRTRLNKQ